MGFFFSVLFLLRNAPVMAAWRLLGWISVGVYVSVYDGAADGQAAVLRSPMSSAASLRWKKMHWPRALPMDDDIARAMVAFNSVGSISSS